jgi:ABC-type branched-subunit amino acid transport system substrate-binding protein
MRGRRVPWFACVAALALSLGVEGCSFLVDSSAEQCSSHEDCTKRGGAFASSVCTKDHICLTSCTTNKSCIDAIGEPAICVQQSSKCAPLLSIDCRTVHQAANAIEKDNAVVLGIMLAHTGGDAKAETPRVNAIELARRHIDKQNAGLPGINGGSARPLVLVACDDAADPQRAARHLAQVVRVPAIVGPAFSGVTTSVAKEVTIPAGVLVISPSATSPSLTALTDNGLVWRTAPSDVLQAKAMTLLVSNVVEREVRAQYSIADTANIRLAVVHKGDTYGAGLGNALFKSLKFNRGQTAAANDTNYKQIDYGDPLGASVEDQKTKYAKAATELIAFKPHILITVGTGEGVGVFANVEKDWTDATMRPRHIVSDGLQVPELLTVIGTNEQLRKRVLGTIGEANGPTFDDFKNEYKIAFGTDTVPDAYAAGAYDATLLLAYAIAGAGNKPLTGALINENLKKTAIPGSIVIEAGPGQINDAFKAMAVGGIDYNGASGPLDFNPDTGEAEANIQIWCPRAAGGGKDASFVASGALFDAKQGMLIGTPTACP